MSSLLLDVLDRMQFFLYGFATGTLCVLVEWKYASSRSSHG